MKENTAVARAVFIYIYIYVSGWRKGERGRERIEKKKRGNSGAMYMRFKCCLRCAFAKSKFI